MLTLYIANKNLSSWSLRPWILLKTLGIPFEEVLENFVDGGSSHSKFKLFSPTGLVPCLVDSAEKITVWDSLAICEYIAEQYKHAWPEAKTARSWARSATAEMHSGFQALRSQCAMNCKSVFETPELNPALAADINRLNQLWEQGFEQFGGPFLAGKEFSIVDAFFAPIVFRAIGYQLPLSVVCQKYLHNIISLPGMQEWLAAAKLEADIEH